MGCCCFRPSLSPSRKSEASLSHLYISPLPGAKPHVSEAQLPSAVSNSVSQSHIVEKKVHFFSSVSFIKDEASENARSELMSLEADSKESSGEGESYSYESLFSLQLVDGWSTSNEEEVMSKEILNNNNSKDESSNDRSTFEIPIHPSCESEEASLEISLSNWLVDLEPENSSANSVNGKSNAVSEKRRVLGELNLVEVNENHSQSLKSSDTDSMRRSITERSRFSKEYQKVDTLHKSIPLGLSLARSALCRGMV